MNHSRKLNLDYKKHVEFFFLSLICAIGSLAVHFIAKVNDNIIQMTIAIHEINVKMESLTTDTRKIDDKIHDHENRIRIIEKILN